MGSDLRPVFYLDHDGSVLCAPCAKESQEHFVARFRPESGPHLTGATRPHCDECSAEIPASETDETVEAEQNIS